MQIQRIWNMQKSGAEKGILGHNYSLAMLSMTIWVVTFGSTTMSYRVLKTQSSKSYSQDTYSVWVINIYKSSFK